MAEYIGAIPAIRIPNLDELDGVDLTSVTPIDGSLLYFDGTTGTWRVPTNNSKFFNEKAGNPFYIDDNNVTIKAFDGVPAGAQGNINGKTYELVDELETPIPVLSVTSLATKIPEMSLGGFLLEDGISTASINSADVSHWDTSSVIDMEEAFQFSGTPLGGWSSITQWDTSNVKNFKETFRSSTLDLDIFDFWDFSSAEDLTGFVNGVNFYRDTSQGGSYDWASFQPPSELKTLKGLFKNSNSFDLDFSNWDTSNITNFENAFVFRSFSFANTPNPFILNDDPNSSFTLENAEKIGGIVQYNSNYNTFDFSTLDFSPTGSLSSVRSLRNFFGTPENSFDASLVDVSTWDTGNITDMSYLTAGRVSTFDDQPETDFYLEGFNSDITGWDTSSVENFAYAFSRGDFQGNSFNQDISGWDTSSATNMERMFWVNNDFNQPIGNWNVSNVTNMKEMFQDAGSFDQDLSGWDTSSVTDFRDMFRNSAITFDPISSWDFSSAVYLGGIVSGTPVFDSIDWTSFVIPENVVDLSSMFENSSSFNDDISGWDVSNIRNFSRMFFNSGAFNQDISNWNVKNAENMAGMFYGVNSFNQDIGNWDVSNVSNMSEMFNSSAFNQDIGYWNTQNVTDMSSMFAFNNSFNQDISYWDTSKVENMFGMFESAGSFNQDISYWNTQNVTDMSSMFAYADSFNADISGWDVSNVEYINSMFREATSFNADISGWDVSNVRNMSYMFADTNFNQDISRWDVEKLTVTSSMFQGNTVFNQNIGHWRPRELYETDYMFSGATAFNQDISRWDMKNVRTLRGMFKNASAFNQDISQWKVGGENFESELEKYIGVEQYSKLPDGSLNLNFVSKFSLLYIEEMFTDASAFNQDITQWNWNGISLGVNIDGSGMSTANYDKILLKVHEEAERRENVKAEYNYYESWLYSGYGGGPYINAGTIQHSSDPAVVAAKDSLEQDYGFTIIDGNP